MNASTFREYQVITKGKLPTIRLLSHCGWMSASFLSSSGFMSFLTLPSFGLQIHFCISPPPLFKRRHRDGDPECSPASMGNQTRYIEPRPCAQCFYLHLPFQRLWTCLNVHTDGHAYCLTTAVSGRRAPPPPSRALRFLARHWSQVFIPLSLSEGLTAAVPV